MAVHFIISISVKIASNLSLMNFALFILDGGVSLPWVLSLEGSNRRRPLFILSTTPINCSQ